MDSLAAPISADSPMPPAYKDRSGGLLACGIVQIILGGLAALMIPLVLLGALLSRKMTGIGASAGSYFMSVATYAFVSGAFIALGIGSIHARRWGRALNLIVSWVWLVVGVLTTILITAVLPASFNEGFRRAAAMNPNAPPPPMALMAVLLTFVIVLFTVFLVVVPAIFVWFFRREDVEETCKRRDPTERWTDRCPLPVLALSLLVAFASLHYLLIGFTVPLVPFFGRYLTGIPGALACLVLAVADGLLAFFLFHLRPFAWWLALGLATLHTISAAITFRRGDLLGAYSSMGWKGPQLEAMSSSGVFRSGIFLWWGLGVMLLFLGYLGWTKRYFTRTAALPSDFPPQSVNGPQASY